MNHSKKNIAFVCLRYSTFNYVVKPLVEHLNKSDVNVYFFHLNKYKDKQKGIETNLQDGINFIDVGNLKYDELKAIFNKKEFKGVFCIGYKSLFDIFMNQFSQNYGLKTTYFEHGLFIKGLGDKYQISSIKDSILRYLFLFNLYLKYLIKEKKNIYSSFTVLKKCIYNNDFTQSKYDNALFYTQEGLNNLDSYFDFNKVNVHYSGYPIFHNRNQQLNYTKTTKKIQQKKILYLHQPLIKDGLCNFTYEDEINYFINLQRCVREHEYSLELKLHPREDINNYISVSKELNISELYESDLSAIVNQYDIIIGQFSTALFLAVNSKIPIILFPYPNSNTDNSYFDIFKEIAPIQTDFSDISNILINLHEYKENQFLLYSKFTEVYLGFPNSFEDQSSQILKIITNN